MKQNPYAAIPMAPGATLLGHGHALKYDRLNFLRSLGHVGPIVQTRFVNRPVLFVCSPELAHELLVEKAAAFEKSPGIRLLLHDLAGEGLFTSEGELWKRQRRLMSPLFHASQLATYTSTMNVEARRAVDRFQNGMRVDLLRESTRIAMSVVGATLFGADTFNQAEEIGEALTTLLGWVDEQSGSSRMTLQLVFIEAVEYLLAHTSGSVAEVFAKAHHLLRTPIFLPGRQAPERQRAIRVLDDRIHAMIRERREHTTTRKDLLTRLLLARDGDSGRGPGQGMSDKQLRDEVNTLFVAGHETTATALAWCFYLLARNPEVRARVQAEADAFGPEGPVQPEPQRLEYTTRVFKEVLRLYPPVLILGRRSLVPVELGGIQLPMHTLILVSPYTVHFHKETWPEPDRFDPDRYLPAREAERPKAAWLPFGLGPRVCIGNHFALLEGPIVLATLLRRARFDIDASRTIEADRFATLRPKGGVPAIVQLRDG